MPTKQERNTIELVALIVLLGGGNLLWTSHVETTGRTQIEQQSKQATKVAVAQAIDANNSQWCDSLVLLTSGPVPTKKQPVGLRLYNDFVTLEHHFGCESK